MRIVGKTTFILREMLVFSARRRFPPHGAISPHLSQAIPTPVDAENNPVSRTLWKRRHLKPLAPAPVRTPTPKATSVPAAPATPTAGASTPTEAPRTPPTSLTQWAHRHAETLRDNRTTRRIGADRRLWIDNEGNATLGHPVDAGAAALALLQYGAAHGDETALCLGRLTVHALPRLQIAAESSRQWGAFQESIPLTGLNAHPGPETRICVRAHSRTTSALLAAQKLWPSETRERSALAGARWLLLRTAEDGLPASETFDPDSRATADISPWTALQAAAALSAAYRHSAIPVFQTAARRMVEAVEAGLDSGRWNPSDGDPLEIGDAVEALLDFARVADNDRWTRLATRIAENAALSTNESPTIEHCLANATSALALARIQNPGHHIADAWNLLQTAANLAECQIGPAHCARVMRLVETVFLRVAGTIPGAEICPVTRTIQLHGCRAVPDPAAARHVQVETPDGETIETRLWACPQTFRVVGAAILPNGGKCIRVVHQGKPVAARCLRTQSVTPWIPAQPLVGGNPVSTVVFSTV